MADFDALKAALLALATTAVNFGARFIKDAHVRENYVRQARAAAREIEAEVLSGAKTAEQGAQEANEMRNALLEAGRLQSSDIGRAAAEAEKAAGLTIEQLQTRYAARLFGKQFAQLTAKTPSSWKSHAQPAGRAGVKAWQSWKGIVSR